MGGYPQYGYYGTYGYGQTGVPGQPGQPGAHGANGQQNGGWDQAAAQAYYNSGGWGNYYCVYSSTKVYHSLILEKHKQTLPTHNRAPLRHDSLSKVGSSETG